MGDTDIEFDGELLAERSTENKPISPDDRFPDDPSRWTVVQIYALDSGKGWVTTVIGKSHRKGEQDRPRTWVCDTPEQVLDSLRRKPANYLTRTASDTLLEAANKDPRLKPVTVEKI
jgi:hypothetical protein